MGKKAEKRTGKRGSILVKIAGLSSLFVFLAVMVMAYLGIRNMQDSSRETAVAMVETKIRGDIHSFHDRINIEYGTLRLEGKTLVRDNGQSVENDYGMIDEISKDLAVVATIFVKDGDDFRRISTSITDSEGKRAVGTMLGTASAAYKPIQDGQTFIGDATILGKHYITGYEPIFSKDRKDIIGILFVGVSMQSVNEIISNRTAENIIFMAISAVVILAVTAFMNIFIFRAIIIKPVNKIVSVLEDVGRGSLNRRINLAANDEIGEMARNFDNTIESIKNLVLTIKSDASQLFDTGNELASHMEKTAAAIGQITANIQTIQGRVMNQSGSVETASGAIEEINGNIQKLNENIEKQTGSVSQSSSAIEEMLANIQSVTQVLVRNTENVTNLDEASEAGRTGLREVAQDIQEIAKESEGLLEINSVIQNIASQTNLLSMNAAIEAAHAGESGKGFAVVADEIRKLAENSSEQSKTIGSVLKNMKEAVEKITRSAEIVLNKFEDIATGVRTVSDQEGNIRNSMEEQGEGSRQILEAISHLNEITGMVRDGSEKMLDSSHRVSQESAALRTETSEITSGMGDMATGAGEINIAVQQVNEISGRNKELIDHLVKSVSVFNI